MEPASSGSTLLSTGAFARLCGVSKDTLFYYDRIGILKPVLVEKNGYRRYAPEQIAVMQLIRFMERFGWSLEDIKTYLRSRSRQQYLQALCAIRQRQEEERNRLEREAALIDSMLCYAQTSPGELSVPVLLSYAQPRTFFATAYRHNDPSKSMKIAASVSDYVRTCNELLGGTRYPIGRMVSRQSLLEGRFMLADALCSPVCVQELERCQVPPQFIRTMPPGAYVRLWYRGDPTKRNGAYPVLLRFLRENHMCIAGAGCELWVTDHFSTPSAEESMAVIEIPVKSEADMELADRTYAFDALREEQRAMPVK